MHMYMKCVCVLMVEEKWRKGQGETGGKKPDLGQDLRAVAAAGFEGTWSLPAHLCLCK